MFFKMVKYDFLFSGAVFLGMGALMTVLAAVLWLLGGYVQVPGMDTLNLAAVLMFIGVAVAVMTTVFQVLQFFHKNFFDDTGYMMLTLPVGRLPLLVSKLVVSLVWLNFMLLAITIPLSVIAGARFSISGIINSIRLQNILALLELSLLAALIIVVLFFVITLANSSIGRWQVPGAVAAAVGVGMGWLLFWGTMTISQRSRELVVQEAIRFPVFIRTYDAGRYVGTYVSHYEYWQPDWEFYRRIIGAHVGRIPIGSFGGHGDGLHVGGYFDIYRYGAGLAVCVAIFFATYYLLNRRISF